MFRCDCCDLAVALIFKFVGVLWLFYFSCCISWMFCDYGLTLFYWFWLLMYFVVYLVIVLCFTCWLVGLLGRGFDVWCCFVLVLMWLYLTMCLVAIVYWSVEFDLVRWNTGLFCVLIALYLLILIGGWRFLFAGYFAFTFWMWIIYLCLMFGFSCMSWTCVWCLSGALVVYFGLFVLSCFNVCIRLWVLVLGLVWLVVLFDWLILGF